MNIYQAFMQGAEALMSLPDASAADETYLMIVAAGIGDADRVRALYAKGAGGNYKVSEPAMIVAAADGHLEVVKALYEMRNFDGKRLVEALDRSIRVAARGGYLEVVKYCHETGGITLDGLWFWAVIGQHVALGRYLRQHGADVNLNETCQLPDFAAQEAALRQAMETTN